MRGEKVEIYGIEFGARAKSLQISKSPEEWKKLGGCGAGDAGAQQWQVHFRVKYCCM
jgi:hypothetical protein